MYFRTDPIEQSPEYKMIEEELERLIDEELKDEPRLMGFCHTYWCVKRRILKERFNIDWKSPAELNPGVMFD